MTNLEIPKYTLIHYVRKNNGEPYGVLVALKGEEGYHVGYSMCRKGDRFEKRMGLQIAIGRANFDTESHSLDNVPRDLKKVLPSFINRCKRYYK